MIKPKINFNHIHALFFLFFFSLFVRIYASFFFNFNFKDAILYKFLATELINNFYYNSDLSMPLYPILMSVSKIVFNNFYVFDFILSSLFPIIIYFLTFEIFKNRIGSLISALVVAIYPMNIFYSISGLSENFYVFFLYSSFLFFYKKNYVFGIIMIILCLYTRAVVLYYVPILILSFIYINNESLKSSIKILIQFFILFIVMFSPWWSLNYAKYDSLVLTHPGTGLVLNLGNNKHNKSGGNDMGVDTNYSEYQSYDSIYDNKYDKDQALISEAISYIQNNPKHFFQLSIKKFKRFWNIFPNHKNFTSNDFYKYIVFFSFLPVLLISIIYFIKNMKNLKNLTPLILFILYTTAVHIVTISSLRYRYPVEPILIILFGQYISISFSKFIKN